MAMQTDAAPDSPVNHVFVDMENTEAIGPKVKVGRNFIVYLFYGPQNKKVGMDGVARLFEKCQSVKLVRSPLTRKNALDFVLAYHLGQAVLTDPKGSFHIIAADEGYDSLVDLLHSRNVKVTKHKDWSTLDFQSTAKPVAAAGSPAPAPAAVKVAKKAVPASKPAAARKSTLNSALSDAATKLLENLKKREASKRPKKEKALIADAKPLCGKNASDAEVLKVIEELKSAKLIAIENGVVQYKL